jgi:predicted transcriptional regulator
MKSENRPIRSSPPSLVELGPLEQRLLYALWARGNATVRELVEDGNPKLVYTTAMTTLDRLYKKGLLSRVREGRAFRYQARCRREEMEQVAARQIVGRLLEANAGPTLPLSYLVEAVTEHDVRLLDCLQEIVERQRRQADDRRCQKGTTVGGPL